MKASVQVDQMHSLGSSIILEEHQQVSKSRGLEQIDPYSCLLPKKTFDIESSLHYDLDQQGQECWTHLQGKWIFAVYRRDIQKKHHQLKNSIELHQYLVSERGLLCFHGEESSMT